MNATTPDPPYYAVIFTTTVTTDLEGYEATAAEMERLASLRPGYLGIESARDPELGITVSYWADEASIAGWKADVDHRMARERGRAQWYASYSLRVARVERAYDWSRSDDAGLDAAPGS